MQLHFPPAKKFFSIKFSILLKLNIWVSIEVKNHKNIEFMLKNMYYPNTMFAHPKILIRIRGVLIRIFMNF